MNCTYDILGMKLRIMEVSKCLDKVGNELLIDHA